MSAYCSLIMEPEEPVATACDYLESLGWMAMGAISEYDGEVPEEELTEEEWCEYSILCHVMETTNGDEVWSITFGYSEGNIFSTKGNIPKEILREVNRILKWKPWEFRAANT